LKKAYPYIFLALIATGILFLFVNGSRNSKKKLDSRITLRKYDKIPYGAWVAYNNLKYIFPEAAIYHDKHEPGYWDSLSNYEGNQAVFILADYFYADEFEMNQLINFVENGNDVFISARELSTTAEKFFNCEVASFAVPMIFELQEGEVPDTLKLALDTLPYGNPSYYSFPGRKFNSYFYKIDSATTDILGYNENRKPNFIHLQAGKGNFYVQVAPVAFTNYFLLHKNNIEYYETALSYIPKDIKKIVWDEYYLNKRYDNQNNEKKKGWFKVLMNLKNDEGKKSFSAAFWLLMLLMTIYVLLEMRRKQRYIPVIKKPKNDSLDFVKTIGRLYHDKGDHRNLCHKMGSYFLEYVRNKFKLPTGILNEEFITNLRYKSGVDESVIRGITEFIKYAEDAPAISAVELNEFNQLLELFYSKT
jgi:hypothetical protein